MTQTVSSGRADRIAALGYQYEAQPKRIVVQCDLCSARRFVVISHADRYGFAAEAHTCLTCGLTFLNPVMTSEAYARFYDSVYRPLVSAFHGRLIDAKTVQAEQRIYAIERGDFLEPFITSGGGSFLDIGGSTGIVAAALARRFGLEATVLDPAAPELDEARRLGLETIGGFIEDYDPGSRTFDHVAMFQTVDHLLSLSRSMALARQLLRTGGHFYADIVDFRAAYLRGRSVEGAIKIDHPYYLTEATFETLLARVGFSVVRKDYARDHLHVGYLCVPVEPIPDALPSTGWVEEHLREIRSVQNAP